MPTVKNWTEVLALRPEVIASDGGVGELQMSLHKAVYQTVDVPYRSVSYYGEITQPTPNLAGFLARVARRLALASEPIALYHLDQGMGGGKSHALVGLYHMATHPQAFFDTELGKQVLLEAESGGSAISISDTRVVPLTADHFSPGKATELFGPAVNLFERFIWSLFEGDRAQYDKFVSKGANKATLQQALAAVKVPVLILLDELMDYAMELSNATTIATMPGEQAFLNALMDACDDVPRVAFIVVMIRSELDPEGYTPLAEGFREYIARRLNRNGTTIAVTETGDFAAIIRRRIFDQGYGELPIGAMAEKIRAAIKADTAWQTQVLERLGSGWGSASFAERVKQSYPFHPDLMSLVQTEWGKAQGFQRVRSTVAIFAIAALHWMRAAKAGEWAPPLIGVGDLPLGGVKSPGTVPQARCLDALLNSGLLMGNDRAIQGYRAVATTDVTSADGTGGRAVELDRKLRDQGIDAGQPNPAVRMAAALFCYSLVSRSQGRKGATKAELMAALMMSSQDRVATFAAVEEVFLALTAEEGLGAVETYRPSVGAERYWLTIKQTLRMFFNAAKGHVSEQQALELVWEVAQGLTTKGQFEEIHFVERPRQNKSIVDVASGIDSQASRLVVLDPRQWTLLNGDDGTSRADVRKFFGVGDGALLVDNAASCVVAAVNTYQRRYAVQSAQEVLTWQVVGPQIMDEAERHEVQAKIAEAEAKLRERVRGAYRHYVFLTRKGDQLEVVFARFDDDKLTALHGNDVWGALVTANRAVGEYMDTTEKRRKRKPLSEVFLGILLDKFDRHLTLKDIASYFYKDPRFPLVPTLDDIRGAVFSLLQAPGHIGEGTGGWELVGSDGMRLQVDDPKHLAINSIQQQLRRIPPSEGAPASEPKVPDSRTPEGFTTEPGKPKGSGTPDSTRKVPAQSYAWYRMELSNRSITDQAKRETVRSHLRWLASRLDDDELDHQLFSLKYDLLAATNEEFAEDLKARAAELDVNRVRIEQE